MESRNHSNGAYPKCHMSRKKNCFMKKILFAAATVILFATSCTTTNKSVSTVPVRPRSSVDPLKVDYVVDMKSKLEGNSKSVWLLGFIKLSGDPTYADGISYSSSFADGQEGFMRLFGSFTQRKIVQAKSAAAYMAVEGKDADFIANPQYTITQSKILFGIVKSYNATVNGYKGKYIKMYQGQPEKNYYILQNN